MGRQMLLLDKLYLGAKWFHGVTSARISGLFQLLKALPELILENRWLRHGRAEVMTNLLDRAWQAQELHSEHCGIYREALRVSYSEFMLDWQRTQPNLIYAEPYTIIHY